MDNVLHQYTVIDFTDRKEIGVTCGTYLALNGFRVIRVEAPCHFELSREDKCDFTIKNLNKECISLNIDTDDGKRLFSELLKKADVLIENHPYNYMESLGFDYDSVKKINPRLIFASIKSYPKESPWRDVKANPATLSAMGGATFVCGYTGGEPVCVSTPLAEVSTSAYAAGGVTAALFRRETDGEGRLVEINGQEAVIAHGRGAFSTLIIRGDNVRVGNWSPNLPDVWPMELYPTKGTGSDADYVVVGALNETMWKDLARSIGKPELIDDPRFNTWEARYKNIDDLDEIIREYTKQYTKLELMEFLLKQNRVVCGAVSTVTDLINDETLAKTGTIQEINDPELGQIRVPTFPAVYHTEENKVVARSPELANDRIYRDLLGIQENEYAALIDQNVI